MKSFAMTPVDYRLLRGADDMPLGVYQLHLTTAEQLCKLHYSPKSIKWVQKRLKLLADNGYLNVDAYVMKRRSQKGKVYFIPHSYYILSSKGIRYLEGIGLDIATSMRARDKDRDSLFVEHTLEINDLLIAAMLLKRVNPRYYLRGFIHEHDWRRVPLKTHSVAIIPDAYLDLRVQTADNRTRRLSLLLEHDCGTEEQHRFRRRIQGYVELLKTGAYRERLQTRSVTIAFTTFIGQKRLEQMRDWTREQLLATCEQPSMMSSFVFAAFDKPLDPCHVWLEPSWYTLLTRQQRIALLHEG